MTTRLPRRHRRGDLRQRAPNISENSQAIGNGRLSIDLSALFVQIAAEARGTRFYNWLGSRSVDVALRINEEKPLNKHGKSMDRLRRHGIYSYAAR